LFAYTLYFVHEFLILLYQHNSHRYIVFQCVFDIGRGDLFRVFVGLSILELGLFCFDLLHDEFWPFILLEVEGEWFELWAGGRVCALTAFHSNNNCY